MNTYSVAIIGAGPSGLALSYHLQKLGISFLLIEKDSVVGSSWKQMPDQLKLISFWKSNFLVNGDESLFKSHELISSEEFYEYLKNLYQKYNFKCEFNFDVISIDKNADGFKITSNDHRVINSKIVVDCRGYYSYPYFPKFELVNPKVQIIHYHDYKNPEQFTPYKKILVMGKRLSAGQVVAELVQSKKFEVALSCRGKIRFSPPPLILNILMTYGWVIETLFKKIGLGKKFKIEVFMDYKVKSIIESNVLVYPDIKKIEENKVIFANDCSDTFDVIILATGFKPPHYKLKNNFERADVENFMVLGREGQRSFVSRFLRGIREDAKNLSLYIEKRLNEN